jgi:hypothetical protein
MIRIERRLTSDRHAGHPAADPAARHATRLPVVSRQASGTAVAGIDAVSVRARKGAWWRLRPWNRGRIRPYDRIALLG